MEECSIRTVSLRHKADEVVLKKLKQQLMSRNVKLQMEAVCFITQSLKNDANKEGQKTLHDILLDADIIEFICEAMATLHCHLLEAIFACLEHLAKSKKFYNNSHVLYVIECLIRTVHFLIKQSNSFHTLNRALSLLAGLLKGFVTFTGSKALQAGAFNVSQVLELIQRILSDKHSVRNETVMCVGWILSNLVESKSLANQLDVTSLQLLVTVLETCITLLSEFVKNHKAMDEQAQSTKKEAVLVMSCVTLSVTRLCSVLSRDKVLENGTDKMANFQNVPVVAMYSRKMTDVLLKCVQYVSAPYILEIDMEISNMELFGKFVCCLEALYCEPVKELVTPQLSHRLGELGYLTFLPVISTWSAYKSKDGSSLSCICISVLGELLSSMSAGILGIESLWPGGFAAFRKHLQMGLGFVPLHCAYWQQALYAPDAPHSLQHAVIVFNYFFCLCASRPDVGTPCLPALVSYLNHLPSVTLVPIPITKAIWFVFAVSSLSYSGPVCMQQATRVLLQLLGQQIQLRNVYTHHPAVLYWVFTSPWIHPSIQKGVVFMAVSLNMAVFGVVEPCSLVTDASLITLMVEAARTSEMSMNLWLEEDQSDCGKDLMDLVMINYDASHCLLEKCVDNECHSHYTEDSDRKYNLVLLVVAEALGTFLNISTSVTDVRTQELIQCGKPQVVKRGIQVMQDAILHQFREGNDELIQTLWDIIPQALARFSSNNSPLQAAKIGGLMQVACMAVPHNLSASTVVRAACLLTRVLANQEVENADTPLAFYKAAISHAFLLLLISMELQDKRTLAIYINEPKFLKVLHTAMESKHSVICSTAVNFLSHLLHYQMIFQHIGCDHVVRIDIEQLLQLLMNPDFDVLSAGLQLTFNLLQSKLVHPAIRLSEKGQDIISPEFLQALFIKLQAMSIKNFPGISNSSWKCLGALLHFSSTQFAEPNIHTHLATQPWTCFLIRSMTRTASISGCHDFLYFISQWLQCFKSYQTASRFKMFRLVCKKERALCPSLHSETLTTLATMFLNCCDFSTVNSSTKQLIQQILNGILESGTDLSEDTCKSLRQRLLDVCSST